ncbi:MAG: T9SS type A sorting domain-containing protein [Saprospiraceae bacterium]|nr:T9SS type A sorting domain-containing protein [Saprospiraceae bacterium]MCB9324823.1 T9SS type A sorting domain-containing protein [Lewinellaceae bacterium]
MKKTISFLLFCCTIFPLAGQQGFEFASLLNLDQEAVVVAENLDGHFILAVTADTLNDQQVKFIELDEEGQILHSQTFFEEGCVLHIAQIFSMPDHYITFGYKDCENSGSRPVWILKLSPELELLEEQVYEILEKDGKFINPRARLISDSTIAFSAIFRPGGLYRPMGGIIHLEEENFEYSIWANNSDYINDFSFRSDSAGYVLFGTRLYFTDASFNVNYIRENVDNNFSIGQQGAIEHINDTLFLLSGRYNSLDKDGIIVGIFNHDFQVIQYDTIATYPEDAPINYPAPKASLGMGSSGDYFYLGGILNIDIFSFPYSNHLSSFVLAKYDMSLDKYWEKTYGGDAYYFMRGLIATSDGGCLMYGFRYQTGSFPEAYALKVDGNGLITGTTRIPLPESPFKIFPNPFQHTLVIDTPLEQDFTIQLFDSSGKLVLKSNFHSTQTLDLSFLDSGSYFYQIWKGQEILKTGKVVKVE